MSQPKLPRRFKFVGGPSRKRRRCTAPHPVPETELAQHAPAPKTATTRATATATTAIKNTEGFIQPETNAQIEMDTTSGPRDNNTYNAAIGAVSGDDDVAARRMPASTSFINETHIPPVTEVLESLLNWPAATGQSTTTDILGPALEFHDSSTLFGAPFQLPTSPLFSLASGETPEPSMESSERYILGDHTLSVIENIPSEGSSNSTEDIEREDGPELQDHSSIPRNLSDDCYSLFAQYDREFCVWPLTHDFAANPFRYDIETGRGSPILWHSILALSYKHINRETGAYLTEAKEHKRKAVRLLEELERDLGSANSRANLLNALLILMTLDCATSAQGPWVAHLSRAQKIIEALGIFRIPRTPRIQAQIDMLVWWDVTLGLTTRQGFVLSGSTISSVLNSNTASTFYNISGCPDELFKYMIRLGAYAREFELASHMTCVIFDMAPVLAVEKAIKEWRAPQYDGPDVDLPQSLAASVPQDWGLDPIQAAHYVQDFYHCAQAWRFALLIYIERVFKWRCGQASLARIGFFARKALNNMMSCRRSVMIQKQLLLPVFLAACETDDENLREEARDYCSWWGLKTRYEMFNTTLGLLEEVWAASADPSSWWGALIDQKSKDGSTRQYLLG